MKNKIIILMICVIAACAGFINCKARVSPLDAYVATGPCDDDFGYTTSNYDHKFYGNFLYYMNATLTEDRVIRSIVANFSDNNDAIVAIYDSSGTLITTSGIVDVDEGWQDIDVPDVPLYKGNTYRLAVRVRYTDEGIRMDEDAGTSYYYYSFWPNMPSSGWGGTAQPYAMLIYGNYCQ